MNTKLYTEEELGTLRSMPKRITNPGARWLEKPKGRPARPHIHRASERAIAAGEKPESEAEETDRFENLEGALARLVADFNLTGLDIPKDHQMRML